RAHRPRRVAGARRVRHECADQRSGYGARAHPGGAGSGGWEAPHPRSEPGPHPRLVKEGGGMARIVEMTADRFDGMNRIDVEAWSDWATKKFGRAMVFPTKQPVYGTYLDGDPEGSFIALDEHEQPVGYIFTRTLGKVGFFGPFGVVPKHQASHVGKALVRATVEYMERSGCTTIGLETMPETAYNLGLYSKLGFRLFTMTLRLHKEIGAGERRLPKNVEVVVQPTEALLARIREISLTLEDGLDQSKEVGLLRQHPLGACLTYSRTAAVCGFALCY